jgi:Ni/Co efflux regulator RcnB
VKAKRWLSIFCCSGMLAAPLSGALAQGHGNGHYRDKRKDKDRDDDDDRRGYGYTQHDRDEIRGWYGENSRRLPPGLAKKDRLPPGLEKQLVVRGHFPPGLERQVQPVPVELERRLPPPPADCERVVVGGHIVLRNRSTNIVLDIFHFE